MPVTPLLDARDVAKVFESFGWRVSRQNGSHIVMVKEGNSATFLPCPTVFLSVRLPTRSRVGDGVSVCIFAVTIRLSDRAEAPDKN